MGRKSSGVRPAEAPNLARAKKAIQELVGAVSKRTTGPQDRKSQRKQERTAKKLRRQKGSPHMADVKEQAVLEASIGSRKKPKSQSNRAGEKPQHGDRRELFGGEEKAGKFRRENLDYANRFEDRELRLLEKQMHIKKNKNKLPKCFAEDGLDYILDMCDDISSNSQQSSIVDASSHRPMSELEKYVQDKRQKAASKKASLKKAAGNSKALSTTAQGSDSDSERMDEGDGGMFDMDDGDSDIDSDEMLGEDMDDEEDEEDDDFDDEDFGDVGSGDSEFASSDADDNPPGKSRSSVKSSAVPSANSAVSMESEASSRHGDLEATTSSTSAPATPSGKYVPPALRKKLAEAANASSSDPDQALLSSPLMRQVKGLINRLCEGTLKSGVTTLQQLYTDNSRNDTNRCLSLSIMSACVTAALQPDRLLAEHMLLVAVLHRLVDTDVGCHFLELLVKRFDKLHSSAGPGCIEDAKEIDNVVLLLSHLYLFKVAHSSLIFDLIRHLLERFQDKDVTLLLLLLRTCGADIRKDDPVALKAVVSLVRSKSAEVTYIDQSRMRYMLDTVMAVCHNNMRKIPGYDPDSLQHRQRVLRGLVPSAVALADAQMNIAYSDFINVEEKGRWWVVGSAWSGRTAPSTVLKGEGKTGVKSGNLAVDDKIMKLARQQHLNTDLRRNIFSILMTCEDVIDAFEKLIHLQLKDKQEREIVHVVLHCCMQEKVFNVFYALLCDKLCKFSRSHQITLKFALWDKLKSLSSLKKRQNQVLTKLLSHLLIHKTLSLTLFKVVDFAQPDADTMDFFQKFFLHLIGNHKEEEYRKVFLLSPTPPPPRLTVFLRFLMGQVRSGEIMVKPDQCSVEQVASGVRTIVEACAANSSGTKTRA